MKVLILNDTSEYHNGCKQVMKFIYSKIENYEAIPYTSKIAPSNKDLLKNVDVLIINGEGTMHDNAARARELLSVAKLAKSFNIKTFLINSVWQRNSKILTQDLKYFDYISVREILSRSEIKKDIDKDVIVNLDLSYYIEVPFKKFPEKNIICGNYWGRGGVKGNRLIKGVGEDGYIDIFNEPWEDIVNKLRNSQVLITGRHHETYAACKARCPFIVMEGNTHKNSGLIKTFNVNIPFLPTSASHANIRNAISSYKEYEREYEKLFNLMESYKFPDFYDKF